MNKETYVVRLRQRHKSEDTIIGVITNIDVIDKIIYQLCDEKDLVFETLASTRTNEYWIFECVSNKMFYLRVDKVEVID